MLDVEIRRIIDQGITIPPTITPSNIRYEHIVTVDPAPGYTKSVMVIYRKVGNNDTTDCPKCEYKTNCKKWGKINRTIDIG